MKYKKLLDTQLVNICRDCFEEIDVLQVWEDATYDETKFAAACVLMACADDADAGPVQVGIVGGEVMEFGKQRGVTQIPF